MKYLITISILLFSCKVTKLHYIIGEYKCKEYTKFGRILNSYAKNPKIIVLGSSLIIKPDSTYIQINCGNTSSGKWEFYNNKIIFHQESNRFNNDSLNKYGLDGKQPKISNIPDTGYLEVNKILLFFKFKEIKRSGYVVYEKK